MHESYDRMNPMSATFLSLPPADLAGIPITMGLMRLRTQGFSLKAFSLFHNAFLFVLSAYMSTECVLASYEAFGWGANFKPICNDTATKERRTDAAAMRLVRVLYIHYLSKAYEFVDTFIVRGCF